MQQQIGLRVYQRAFVIVVALSGLVWLQACGNGTTSFRESTSTDRGSSKNGSGGSESGGENSSSKNVPKKAEKSGSGGSSRKSNADNSYGQQIPYGPGEEEFEDLELASEDYNQIPNNKVDMLFVVDVSGSMAEEQAYLTSNFSAFIAQLANSGMDYRVAVTNTDVCHESNAGLALNEIVCPIASGGNASTRLRGSFRKTAGNSAILTPTTPNLDTLFTTYANVGTNGSGFEHGLTAAKLAVQKVLNGQNEPLLRSDAFFSVIVISDEEDDGIALGLTDHYNGRNFVQEGLTSYQYTHADFIQDMQTVKGQGMFAVSTITGTRLPNGNMCSAPHSQPMEEGTQYINAARETGGIIQSICDTNWNQTLTQIGQNIASQSNQFVLELIPVASSIKVWVNGVQSSQWTYNSGNNAVKFNPGHVPSLGQIVTIKYFIAP